MRSATSRMRLSCVTSRIVVPRSLASDCMRSTTSRPDCLSSDAVGSSASRIARLGDAARARSRRAGAGRPRAARPLVRVLAEPDGLEHRIRPAPRSARAARPVTRRPSSTFCEARQRVEQVVLLEDEADAPAHVLERRALAARRAPGRARAGCPPAASAARRPASAASSCRSPDGPVTMTISPGGISVETSNRICLRSAPLP